ncbi:tandem-95 repeat protein [Chloroflexi bacterium TSY]|nr:tandem-95 repeat protein [Chloroflexi bacterium TSY]
MSLNPDGSFTYTPNSGFTDVDAFFYRPNDGIVDGIQPGQVRIEVLPGNNAPVAVDDAYSTNEDTALTVPAPGVLANDNDGDGDPLTRSWSMKPTVLSLNPDGSFTYTPNTNFNGGDSFTYQNDGGSDSSITTVTITVDPVNDAPVATDDAYATNEDTALTVPGPGVLENDSDVEGDALTAVLVSNPNNGSVTLNADGSFTYTPNADFNGSDSFTYKANDGEDSVNPAIVTITVDPINDAPVAADDAYTTSIDTPLTVSAPGVLANDSDVEGDPLTASLQGDVTNGTLTLNADGSFSYTPNPGFVGDDSFTYVALDGPDASNTVTVTITVASVNSAPVAVDDTYSTDEGTLLDVPAPGVLTNDSDADGDTLAAVLVNDVSNGTLSLNADGSFTYTPNAGFVGDDTFTYKANDGQEDSNTVTVTITVASVNNAPVAADDAYSTDEGTLLDVPAPGVLTNDSDADDDTLMVSLVNDVSNGTLSLNTDGSFTYTSNAGFVGDDTFTYKANDGLEDSNTVTDHHGDGSFDAFDHLWRL